MAATPQFETSEYAAARRRFLSRLHVPADLHERSTKMGLHEFVEAWNRQDAEAVAAQFAPDGVRHQFSLPEARLAGRDAIAQGVGAIIQAVPDAALDVRSQVEGTDGRIVVEWTFSGTHQNDFPGMPASGATFVLPGISLFSLGSDGLITLENVYWDTATLMAAAGVLG
jgi:steroid delta-isomerase-like uncharacterized protein